MIISVGVDGSGYQEIHTGPGLLVSFTHTDNMLLWITQNNGEQGKSVFVSSAGGCLHVFFGFVSIFAGLVNY